MNVVNLRTYQIIISIMLLQSSMLYTK